MNPNEIARQLFVTLERSTFYKGRYNILNDLNYVDSFYVDSDEEAIKKFNEYLKENKL